MTISAIIAAWGQDALYAAQQEADIADQFEGTGEPFFDELSKSHRAISLALLAYHITQHTH